MALEPADARALLGVDRRAGRDEIRRAYRRLARVHHPDAGGDVATFQELTAAVDLLTHPRMQVPEATRSPSTGRRAYPSTGGQYASAAGAVFHEGEVDTAMLQGARLPTPGTSWSPASLARAVATALADPAHGVALVGLSRRPGSRLNRFTRHLSDDLLSSWRIEAATRRGMPDHDLEVLAHFPTGARKHVERADLPPGWSTVRNPNSTESTFVVHPARAAEATAVLAATAVDEFCRAIGWPLTEWRSPT